MSETIGEQLKQARESRNLSIEQVVDVIRIRAHAIAAMEADDFESFPSATQARGFLKLYADFLGLSLPDMLARQRGDIISKSNIEIIDSITTAQDRESKQEEDIQPPVQKRKVRLRKKVSSSADKEKTKKPPIQDESTVLEQSERKPVEDSIMEGPSADEPVISEEKNQESTPSIPSTSQATYNNIGATLLQRRVILSISLDEVEKQIHIRRKYLELLEEGRFSDLPSSVQSRGMLSNYARFLDLDVDSLLLKFAEALQIELVERKSRLTAISETGEKGAKKIVLPVGIRRFLSLDFLFGGTMFILLVIFIIWGTGRLIRLNAAATPLPSAPSISNVLLSTTLAETLTPAVSMQVETAISSPISVSTLGTDLPPVGDEPVQVVLVPSRSVWLKVVVDNVTKFLGRTEEGLVYSYSGNSQIEVIVGDGSAVSIIYNQTDLGPMGAYGELVHRIYTPSSILLPTSTPTSTPTITPTPTNTLRPSSTPRPSNTPFR